MLEELTLMTLGHKNEKGEKIDEKKGYHRRGTEGMTTRLSSLIRIANTKPFNLSNLDQVRRFQLTAKYPVPAHHKDKT